MNSLQSTAKSEHIPRRLRLRIDPASRCPATFEPLPSSDEDKIYLSRKEFRFQFAPEGEIPYHRKYFGERAERSCEWSYRPYDAEGDFEPDLGQWQRLAAGEAVEMNHPLLGADIPGTGTLNWVFGVGRRPFGYSPGRFLSFIPSGSLPEGIALPDWQKLRFPFFSRGLHDLTSEAIGIFLYRRWVEETSPADTHPSHRGVLHDGAIENLEHLVAAVLQQVRRVDEGPVEAITETALGIAMENMGKFSGMGMMQGVHRHYRDDDFTRAEDSKTWRPRAQRIAAMLEAAGAIDYSPIFDACLNGEVDEVRRLLADGYPPNFAVYGYLSALSAAVDGGNAEVCQRLLEAGADPNYSRPYSTSMTCGGTQYPLESAGKDPALIKLLLDAGADPSIQNDDSDRTPIAFRGAFSCKEGARLIFSKTPFASIRDRYGKTGLFHLSMDEIGYCEEWIPRDLVDEADAAGFTPLMFAIVSGQDALVDWLLEAGASVDKISSWAQDYVGFDDEYLPLILTPLQAAMLSGKYPMMVRLLANGAQPRETLLRFERQASFEVPEDVLVDVWWKIRDHLAALSPKEEASGLENGREDPSKPPYCPPYKVKSEMLRLICCRPDLSGEFPQLLKTENIGPLAAHRKVSSLCLRAYEVGAALSGLELLRLAEEAVTAGQVLAKEFIGYIRSGETDPPSRWDLDKAINRAEELVDLAKITITEEISPQRHRSSEIIAAASEEFDGGNARARRALKTGEAIDLGDLIDAIKEKADPGSTMDLGKLGQQAQRSLAELEQECVELMRKL